MSSICGIARTDTRIIAASEIDAMLAALDHWSADHKHSSIVDGAGMGHLLSRVSNQAVHERQPYFDADSGLLISADVRLDNREDLAQQLGMSAARLKTIADGKLVLLAYQRWQHECVQRLRGDFAFAIWDVRSRKLFCARDPLGIRPFFYSATQGEFVFASEMKGLLALPFVDRSVDELWIADYLHNLILDHNSTLYANIRRLEPGHVLIFSEAGLRKSAYWQFDTELRPRLKNEQEYVEAFRDKFETTMRRHLSTDSAVGGELSGGLDSSAICAVALAQLGESERSLLTFAQLADPEYTGHLPRDGRSAVELFCERAGIKDCTHVTGAGAGVLDTLDWANRTLDEPARVLVVLFNDMLHDAAAGAGVRILLSGWGGNQGVSDPATDITHNALHPAQWRSWLGNKLLKRENTEPYWQKFAHLPLRDELRERFGMRERAQQVFGSHGQPRSGADRIIFKLTAPEIAARMEIANLATSARRIEYRYPLLDLELIEFFMSVPREFAQRRNIPRYFFRRVVEHWVPREICWSNARASANPGAISRRRRDGAALRERLEGVSAHSRVHDYVDVKKLSVTFEVKGPKSGRLWERENDLLKVLMLDHKLR